MLGFDPNAEPPNPEEFCPVFWLAAPKPPDDWEEPPKADEPNGFWFVEPAVDPKALDPNPLDPEFWLVEPNGDDVDGFENAEDPNAPPLDGAELLPLNGFGLFAFDPNAPPPLDGDENGFALFWLADDDPIAPNDEPNVGWLEPNNEFELPPPPPPEDANNLLLNCWPGFVKKLKNFMRISYELGIL